MAIDLTDKGSVEAMLWAGECIGAEQIRRMTETLSVPAKTLLLAEGQVADRLFMIRKGCLRLFFCHEGKDITFQFFFRGGCGRVFRQPL